MLRQYPPIVHEDGLETAILGLEMEVTRMTFYSDGGQSSTSAASSGMHRTTSVTDYDAASSMMTLRLRCRSEVATQDYDADTIETHHQKSAVHTSLGYLFLSGK